MVSRINAVATGIDSIVDMIFHHGDPNEPMLEVVVTSADLCGFFDPLGYTQSPLPSDYHPPDSQYPYVEVLEDDRWHGNTDVSCGPDGGTTKQTSLRPVWNHRFLFRPNGSHYYRFRVCLEHGVRMRTVVGECGITAADAWTAAAKFEKPIALGIKLIKFRSNTQTIPATKMEMGLGDGLLSALVPDNVASWFAPSVRASDVVGYLHVVIKLRNAEHDAGAYEHVERTLQEAFDEGAEEEDAWKKAREASLQCYTYCWDESDQIAVGCGSAAFHCKTRHIDQQKGKVIDDEVPDLLKPRIISPQQVQPADPEEDITKFEHVFYKHPNVQGVSLLTADPTKNKPVQALVKRVGFEPPEKQMQQQQNVIPTLSEAMQQLADEKFRSAHAKASFKGELDRIATQSHKEASVGNKRPAAYGTMLPQAGHSWNSSPPAYPATMPPTSMTNTSPPLTSMHSAPMQPTPMQFAPVPPSSFTFDAMPPTPMQFASTSLLRQPSAAFTEMPISRQPSTPFELNPISSPGSWTMRQPSSPLPAPFPSRESSFYMQAPFDNPQPVL